MKLTGKHEANKCHARISAVDRVLSGCLAVGGEIVCMTACTAIAHECGSLHSCLEALGTAQCTTATLVLDPSVYRGVNNTNIHLPTSRGVQTLDVVGNNAIIDANHITRHFHVTQQGSLRLTNLTLRAGLADTRDRQRHRTRDLRFALCSLLWHHATSANVPCFISGERSRS